MYGKNLTEVLLPRAQTYWPAKSECRHPVNVLLTVKLEVQRKLEVFCPTGHLLVLINEELCDWPGARSPPTWPPPCSQLIHGPLFLDTASEASPCL